MLVGLEFALIAVITVEYIKVSQATVTTAVQLCEEWHKKSGSLFNFLATIEKKCSITNTASL